jgi:LacI family transcriptional regulator
MSTVSMKDLAERAGVSRTAVSFVLNGRAREKGISRAVEQRVQRVARELGYQPSRVARSLAGGKSMTIGLVLPHMNVSYCPSLAERIEREAQQHQYQLILSHHGEDNQRFVDALRSMIGWRVDGIIAVPLVPRPGADAAINQIKQLDVPVVLVERDADDPAFNLVGADVAQAVRLSVRHLIELGHRRIALLDAPGDLVETRQREDTFRRMIDEAGLSPDDCPTTCGEPRADAAMPQAQQMLARTARPTAIVAVSAERAIATYHACQSAGLQIPRDMSVVAITGQRFDDFHRMRFTSARLRYEEMGEVAFDMLMEQIGKRSPVSRRVHIAPQWIDGASTAPPTTTKP